MDWHGRRGRYGPMGRMRGYARCGHERLFHFGASGFSATRLRRATVGRGRGKPQAGRVRSPDCKLASFMEGIMAGWRRVCGLPETKNDGIWSLGNQIGREFTIYDLRFTNQQIGKNGLTQIQDRGMATRRRKRHQTKAESEKAGKRKRSSGQNEQDGGVGRGADERQG